MTVEAGAIVISVLIEEGCGEKSFRSGRNPALGTLSLSSASAMSQAVYLCKAWICSLLALGNTAVAIVLLEIVFQVARGLR